jgi:dihydroneopterin aldolase
VNEPVPFLSAQPAPQITVERVTVFVRGARIEAEIGVHAHEHGRRQPLIIDVALEIEPRPIEHITETVNYERVVDRARGLAASGHFKLVETFAERLARVLLEDPRVLNARVRVEKPEALAPTAEAAGVEVVLTRSASPV